MKSLRIYAFAAALVLVSSVLFASDWPQWRGINRDGSAQGPVSWPEKLNRKWKIAVGEGHSSPILAAGKLFLLTRQNDQEVAMSVDPTTGKVVWQQGYAAPYKVNPAAAGHGQGPKSTPIFSQGRLFTLGISGLLSCFDASTGKVLWRKDFSKQFKQTSPDFGTSMSPMIDNGLVIAHVGGSNSGALAAFDANSGDTKWSWTGDGPGYASPILVELSGTRQVVTQTQQNIVAVSAARGEFLWKMPYTTPFVQNIVTPVVYKNMLIFSGLDNGTMGVQATKTAKGWSTEKIWSNAEMSMYMSSPVLHGDLLFGFGHKNKGQLFCLNAQNGTKLWATDGRQGDNAAVVLAGDHLVLLKDDAEMIVAKVSGKGFEPMRHYTVADSPTWAHPIVTDAGLFIKDAQNLYFWSF